MVPTRVIPISVGKKIKLSPKMTITIDAMSRMFFIFIFSQYLSLNRVRYIFKDFSLKTQCDLAKLDFSHKLFIVKGNF